MSDDCTHCANARARRAGRLVARADHTANFVHLRTRDPLDWVKKGGAFQQGYQETWDQLKRAGS